MCLDVNSDNKKDAESQCLTFRFYCGDSRPCDNSEYVHKKGGIGSDQRNRQQPHGSPYLHRQYLQTGQGPEPRFSPHRPRRMKPRVYPLPHDRHRHEEGSREDFGGKAVIDW